MAFRALSRAAQAYPRLRAITTVSITSRRGGVANGRVVLAGLAGTAACCAASVLLEGAHGAEDAGIAALLREVSARLSNIEADLGIDSGSTADKATSTASPKKRGGVPRLVIFGPPGSGKGTQCAKIVDTFGVVHISTGDLFRAEIAKGTPVGRIAKSYIDRGALCPTSIGHTMLQNRLAMDDVAQRGYCLDGFPREAANSQYLLDNGEVPDVIIVLDVPDDVLVERLAGRRFDPVTKQTYHLTYKKPDSIEVASRLTKRSDDTPDVARIRIAKYKDRMAESLGPFDESIVATIDGSGPPKQVFEAIRREISRTLATRR